MGVKLDEYLAQKLESMGDRPSDEEVPVIVTTRSGAKAADLEFLRVEHSFESISAISGRIQLSDLTKLEALDQVEKIEFDGQMYAQ